MSKFYSLLCVLTCAMALHGQDPNKYEAGIMIGEPSGISGKYWLTRNDALDAVVGWSFTEEIFDLAADYQRHFYPIELDKGLLPVYFGFGAGLQFGSRDGGEDDAFFGARIPVGIAYLFDRSPISIFGEIAPVMELIPETELRLSGGLGIRLKFGAL